MPLKTGNSEMTKISELIEQNYTDDQRELLDMAKEVVMEGEKAEFTVILGAKTKVGAPLLLTSGNFITDAQQYDQVCMLLRKVYEHLRDARMQDCQKRHNEILSREKAINSLTPQTHKQLQKLQVEYENLSVSNWDKYVK